MPRVSARPTLRHGTVPPASGAVTGAWYTSPGWLAAERSHLWPSTWLFVGMSGDVREPGDFLVLDIGRESIVVARDEDGRLAASYNACQHRGAKVVTTPRGCTERFVCPYHGWSYKPDGRLVVVPDHDRFPSGVDRNARSLRGVRVAERAGLVFVTMADSVPDLDTAFGPVLERIAPYGLGEMAIVGDQTVELDCNWKAVIDNFGELYHVEHIHPQHQTLFDCPTALVELFEGGHTGVVIDGHTVNTRLPIPAEPTPFLRQELKAMGVDPVEYEGNVLGIRADYQRLRRSHGPALGYDDSRLTDERLSDVEQYNLFPNVIVTVQPDDALIMRARPHPSDPDKCVMDKLTLIRVPDPEVARAAGVDFAPPRGRPLQPPPRPDNDRFTQDDIIDGTKTMTITIDQDIHLLRDIQSGMHSRGFHDQQLCSDEERIQHFHDVLLDVIGPAVDLLDGTDS